MPLALNTPAPPHYTERIVLAVCLFFLSFQLGLAQVKTSFINNNTDIFGTRSTFVQNIGQYGDTVSGFGSMGTIFLWV
jgi:hypothetical protein